jgi:hypothetical protein
LLPVDAAPLPILFDARRDLPVRDDVQKAWMTASL